MPYEGERAKHIALQRIVNSKTVRSFLTRCAKRPSEPIESRIQRQVVPASDRNDLPRFVLAVDGSYHPVPIDTGFPELEIGFLSVATVLLNVDLIRTQGDERIPDPVQVGLTTTSDSVEFALPGGNVHMAGVNDPKHAFRREFYDALSRMPLEREGESLLDTYHALLAHKSAAAGEMCPYDAECESRDRSLPRGEGEYTCPCPRGQPLYGTDALRIHEAFNPSRSSGEAYGEAMQVVEHLTIINFLRTLEVKDWLDSLEHIAIVLDGPLGVFGHPAWMKDAIQKELQRINHLVVAQTGRDMLMLGIEKTGKFMEHLVQLDTNRTGSPGELPCQSAMLLRDDYIKRYIAPSASDRPYGSQTYFGRKFLYKTESGARIVAMTPYLEDQHADLSVAELDQFPRIADAVALLDLLVSTRYPDAVIPIVEAHAEAAIARGVGTRVLQRLAQELMNGPGGQQ